jgi:hypothetical protein
MSDLDGVEQALIQLGSAAAPQPWSAWLLSSPRDSSLPGHYDRPLGRRINVCVSTSIGEALQDESVAAEVTKVDKTDVPVAWTLIIHNPWARWGRMQQR